MRTVEDEITKEKLKHIKALEFLQSIRTDRTQPSTQRCPQCKTINYHYNASSDSWACAFC